jgi:hypothetical protein
MLLCIDAVEKEVRTFIQMIFLCINTLFAAVYVVMSGEQCVRALQTLSFIQFARVPVALYDQIVHAIAQQAAVDTDNLKGVVELFPIPSKGTTTLSRRLSALCGLLLLTTRGPALLLDDGDLKQLDGHELARLRFFMVAVLPILPLVPENLLSEHLLPMMFKYGPSPCKLVLARDVAHRFRWSLPLTGT